LIARLVRTEADSWADLYEAGPTDLTDPAGVRVVRSGPVTGTIAPGTDTLALNRLLGLGLADRAWVEQNLDGLLSAYRDAGASRFFVSLSPEALARGFDRLLEQRGLHYHNNWVKFYRDTLPLAPVTSDLAIRPVGREFGETFAGHFCEALEWPEYIRACFAEVIARPGWQVFGAFDGDRSVASAAVRVVDKAAWLSFASTLPSDRGRGAQAALLQARIAYARQCGCELVVVETGEETKDHKVASCRNIRRHGFTEAYRIANYVWER
jgi:GNAT superfamily N-acetyltransferase